MLDEVSTGFFRCTELVLDSVARGVHGSNVVRQPNKTVVYALKHANDVVGGTEHALSDIVVEIASGSSGVDELERSRVGGGLCFAVQRARFSISCRDVVGGSAVVIAGLAGYMTASVSSALRMSLASCEPCNSTERTRVARGRVATELDVEPDASLAANLVEGPGDAMPVSLEYTAAMIAGGQRRPSEKGVLCVCVIRGR